MKYTTIVRIKALAISTLLLLTIHSRLMTSASAHQPIAHPSTGQSPSQVKLVKFEGKPKVFGQGTVRTYIALDAKKQPQEIGIILTKAALNNLPHEQELILPLPKAAIKTGFTHVGFNWQSHGHNPGPIYGVPHFDCHFYTLTIKERNQITAIGPDLDKAYKTPEAKLIPTGYVLAPDSAEPRMGSHWIDPKSEEFQGAPRGFSRTFIYGFYNGKMAFIEPMVSLDFLKSQQTFESAVPVSTSYSKPGNYPTGYRITYNPAKGEHIVALTGLKRSQPKH